MEILALKDSLDQMVTSDLRDLQDRQAILGLWVLLVQLEL